MIIDTEKVSAVVNANWSIIEALIAKQENEDMLPIKTWCICAESDLVCFDYVLDDGFGLEIEYIAPLEAFTNGDNHFLAWADEQFKLLEEGEK